MNPFEKCLISKVNQHLRPSVYVGEGSARMLFNLKISRSYGIFLVGSVLLFAGGERERGRGSGSTGKGYTETPISLN